MKCDNKCKNCMKDAPYRFCCKFECGQHEFCNLCKKKYISPDQTNEFTNAVKKTESLRW